MGTSKITIKKLLKLDDKKGILNELIDFGIIDAEAVVCVLVKRDSLDVYYTVTDFAALGVLQAAEDKVRELINQY